MMSSTSSVVLHVNSSFICINTHGNTSLLFTACIVYSGTSLSLIQIGSATVSEVFSFSEVEKRARVVVLGARKCVPFREVSSAQGYAYRGVAWYYIYHTCTIQVSSPIPRRLPIRDNNARLTLSAALLQWWVINAVISGDPQATASLRAVGIPE